jgi:CRP/FNR family transcriptional regulator, cyclic AMP receptor protein
LFAVGAPFTTGGIVLERFQNEDGHARLITALRMQQLVQDNAELAAELAQVGEVLAFETGKHLITQDAVDSDIYFLILGKVEILVKDRVVAYREGGTHIGEMGLVDPTAKRSATNRAAEATIALKVSEGDFAAVIERHPEVWRRLFLESASRLRERGSSVRQPNPKAIVFIGSSVESLEVAREIQDGLAHDNVLAKVWTDNVFQASSTSVEDLEQELEQADLAVLVVGPDDHVTSRKTESEAPRDNVIFELGFFMGGLGRERTFVVRPRGLDLKIPSDLRGVSFFEYVDGSPETLAPRLAPVCNGIRKKIQDLGAR